MNFVNGFEQATLKYMDEPNVHYYMWHPYTKKDGSEGNRVGSVRNHYYLMEILGRESFDIYDEHLSVYHFRHDREGKHSVTGRMPDATSVVVNKVFFDIDPPEAAPGTANLFYWQDDKLRQLQSFRQEIPSRIYATGRGFLAIIDLDKEITIAEAESIQLAINKKYDLGYDTHVPITPLRVFKIPYTKNSKTNTWVLPVLPLNTWNEVWRMQRYDVITGQARWLEKTYVDPTRLIHI